MGGAGVSPQSANSERGGLTGDGTAGNPYKIATAEQLDEFRKIVEGGDTDAWAELTDDIDLNPDMKIDEDGTVTGNPDQWTPIGTNSSRYSGNFNGQNFKISGLYINDSRADYQGLFGFVGSEGTVQNLTVSGSVSGHLYVGGIAGQNGGNVINCTNTGSVSGVSTVGGVVGVNIGSVENCYNTGSVTSNDSLVGGVVGHNGGPVKNCYNTGTVSSNIIDLGGVGGVVGYNYSGGSVTSSYNTGEVSGSGLYVGGVVGYNEGGGSVTGCYFLQTADVNKDLQGIGNKGSAEGAAAVNDLDTLCEKFKDDTWTTSPFCEHPVLQANPEGGLGTATHPYEIKTIDQLKIFRDLVNDENDQTADPDAHAKLMENIDLNPGITFNADGTYSGPVGVAPQEWTPIGNDAHQYIGTFDGNGKTISGLYIDDSTANNQGLFGYVGTGGTVQNLTVSGSVSGKNYVGGVVGDNRGSVEDCDFTGSVTGTVDYVGGVVGYNGGTVKNCYNIGNISGNTSGNQVGGIVGQNSGTVENCYNTGNISGDISIDISGGVVGWNASGTVKNCYNTGNISGNTSGGVVGYNISSVINCYNTGEVSGNWYVGGVVGWNESGTVKNCYNIGDVSGKISVGGVVGLNGGTVENCYYQQHNSAIFGIGGTTGDNSSQTEIKSLEDFHSGEVAYLLGEAWGQSALGTKDSWPTLVALDKNAKPVYKVAFISDNTEIEAQYANSGMTVGSPTTNPTKEGYTFAGWFTKSSGGSQWNFSTAVTENMTLYAQWTAVEDPEPTPDPEPEEPPYTGKYSYEISTDIGDNGSLSVDRYATEGEKVTISVTPDEAYLLDDLSVTAGGKDVELTANGDGTFSFTMPSADVKISATFAEDPDWTPDEPEEPATDVSDLFIDIAPDAWYKDAIQYAYDNGLMTGVSATEFAPEATTTRAMIVSILARLEGVTTAEAAGFADVDDNDWYATAVNWAANVGVVNGYEDNTFKPNTAITREQLAAILMNYAAYKGYDVSARADLSHYSDADSISSWANDVLLWAVAEGLLTGVTDDTIAPQAHATRAQVAAILQRFLSE